MKPKLTIGTRGSDLALYQANFIKDILTSQHGCDIALKIIKTSGDLIDDIPFDKMEGKGFFTKEIERELLEGTIDLAVHSLKDLMTSQPDGLKLGAVGYRADKRELLLCRKESYQDGIPLPLKPDSVIGTSSARRQCQIAFHNPSLRIRDLRGNVPTRIRKLRDGGYDAILIASAGVSRLRLDVSDLVSVSLDADMFLPAPAQGVLGIQIRSNDSDTEAIISRLGSLDDLRQANLERGLLSRFDGGCSLPLGVCCKIDEGQFTLTAILGVRESEVWIGLKRASVRGSDPDSLIDEAYSSLGRSELCCA